MNFISTFAQVKTIKIMSYKDENLEYIRKGKTGCVFATILSRNPKNIGWVRIFNPDKLEIPQDAKIVSLIFTNKNKQQVIEWALANGMYEESTSKKTTGLRINIENNISWVQYFGMDSHVKTRQSPHSELLFCCKLPKQYYLKVGFEGILHLAHASVEHLKQSSLDTIWNSCFIRTKKILGYTPTINEAAKTTFKK